MLPFSSALGIFPGDFQGTAIPKHTHRQKVASLRVRLTLEWNQAYGTYQMLRVFMLVQVKISDTF